MKINENIVAGIWTQLPSNTRFYWREKIFELAYPGRRIRTSGCDFENAVIIIDGQKFVGNVELHVKTSNWYHHGHHKDSRYRDILLHVVLKDDNGLNTISSNGRSIPTVSLEMNPFCSNLKTKTHVTYHHPMYCARIQNTMSDTNLNRIIQDAGYHKYWEKIDLMRKLINNVAAEQLLYQYIARALGYSSNSAPFEELTRRLPIFKLKDMVYKYDHQTISACIIGVAGLLPSQRVKTKCGLQNDDEARAMESIWSNITIDNIMCEDDWKFHGIRPSNMPVRRLIALSYLLVRFLKTKSVDFLIRKIYEGPADSVMNDVSRNLFIKAEGYWGEHLDFGLQINKKISLLGEGRVKDIIVNVILPFGYLFGEKLDDTILRTKCIELYQNYPALCNNYVIEYMRQMLSMPKSMKINAILQQGLIYIYQKFCKLKNCERCPILTD